MFAVALALALGGAFLALTLVASPPALVTSLGVVLVLAGFALAFLRGADYLFALATAAVVAVIAIVAFLVERNEKWFDDLPNWFERLLPVVPIVVLAALAMLLGVVRKRPAKQTTEPALGRADLAGKEAADMDVYEAMVKGLESAGVDTAFGGNGENVASLMLALKHSDRIRPIMTRHEQAASFMACGYAMFTDRLGVCFATVGPGAFNLFSGLAVAMSDSYPVLAITGYVSLEWQGRGAVNDTSGLNGTPDSQAMFAATTKKSYLLTDINDTCDVLEEAVNLAFEGRPGPVHIHVPQNLTYRGVEVENYHDVRLDVAPVVPDPAGVEAIAAALGGCAAGRPPRRRSLRLRLDPQPRGGRARALRRAVPDPAGHHAGRQGRHRGTPPSGRRGVLGEWPLERLEGVPRSGRRPRDRQLAQPARDLRPPRRPVRRQDPDPDQHLGDRDRQDLQAGPCARRRRPPGRGGDHRGARAAGRSGRACGASTAGTGRRGRSRTYPARSIPAGWRR